MEAQAYQRLTEILGELANAAQAACEFGEANDPRAFTDEADIRSAYEQIVQQVFPLVAGLSVMEALGAFQSCAAELVTEVANGTEGLVPPPKPTPIPPAIDGQRTIEDEL